MNQKLSTPQNAESTVTVIYEQPIQPQPNSSLYPQTQPPNYNPQNPQNRNKIPSLTPLCVIVMSLVSLICCCPIGIAVTILFCVSASKSKQLSRNGSVITKIEAEALAVHAYRLFYTSILMGFLFIFIGFTIGISVGIPIITSISSSK